MEVDVLGPLNSPYNFSGRKARVKRKTGCCFLNTFEMIFLGRIIK